MFVHRSHPFGLTKTKKAENCGGFYPGSPDCFRMYSSNLEKGTGANLFPLRSIQCVKHTEMQRDPSAANN